MTIDKSEKAVLVITLLTICLFVFSLLYSKNRYKTDLPECVPYNKSFTEPRVNKLDDKTYQVFMVAQMWQFQPSEIYVPTGSEVDFYLTSQDVVHGFNISKKDVNMMAVYGNINKTSVKFEKPGVYDIVCHEYCGVGHQNMHAKVIVGATNQQQ